MTTNITRWRAVHDLFDPAEPAPAHLRVDRGRYNPLAEKITPRLGLPLPHQKYLLAGPIGSGKSTELRAAAAGLTGHKLVILVDLQRHFQFTVVDPNAIDRLQPAELVGLLSLAVLRTGSDVLGHRWGPLATRLEEAIGGVQQRAAAGQDDGPAVDVVKLAKGVAVSVGGLIGGAAGAALGGPAASALGALGAGVVEGGLNLLDAVADATEWSWKLGQRGEGASSDQDPRVRAVLAATNALLDAIRSAYQRDVVLLVDGLDRVQDNATFESLFVNSSLVAELRADLVVTLRLGLVQRHRARLHAWKSYDFTNVPVVDRADPTATDLRGLGFFRALTQRRMATLAAPRGEDPAFFTDEQVDRLAHRCGGRLRDFMYLVREVAIAAMLRDAATATDPLIDKVVDEMRRDRESGLNADELALLRGVLHDPQRDLPAGEVATDLLDRQLLLPYPNESTWYLPHPILLTRLMRTTGGPASG
jgi:hypothetical protein